MIEREELSFRKDIDSEGWILQLKIFEEMEPVTYRYGVSPVGNLFIPPLKTNVIYNQITHFEFYEAPLVRMSDILTVSFFGSGIFFTVPYKKIKDLGYSIGSGDTLHKTILIPLQSLLPFRRHTSVLL